MVESVASVAWRILERGNLPRPVQARQNIIPRLALASQQPVSEVTLHQYEEK